jgi:lipopolysaccharide transport system permease protein
MQIIKYKYIFTHRDLLSSWTYRIIKARYQQSLLGGLWAILQPAASVAIFTLIFTIFIPIETGNIPYVVFSFTAMVPWTFFSSSINDMVDSLVVNTNLVTKIYFPREILPLAALLARLVDFFIAYCVLILLLLYFRLPVNLMVLMYLPIILGTQILITVGVGFFGAAINVFFRDIKHLIILILQIWFYSSPIIYPITQVPESLRIYYSINPMVGIIEGYRAVILYGTSPNFTFLISAIVSSVFFVLGIWFFKKMEMQFADVI